MTERDDFDAPDSLYALFGQGPKPTPEADQPKPPKVKRAPKIVWEDERPFSWQTGSRRTGWYIMPRGWMEWDAFKPEPYTQREAFIWAMEQAAFKKHRQWFNGSPYAVKRGEFVTSLHTMMKVFGWTEKRVRDFIQQMIDAGYWAKRGAHSGAKAPTVLIVRHYAMFQNPTEGEDDVGGFEEE